MFKKGSGRDTAGNCLRPRECFWMMHTAYQLLYNVSDQKAAKLIEDTDKRRMTNYNFYTGQKWGKASNYTLCLNSSQLGYGRCEAVIMECAK